MHDCDWLGKTFTLSLIGYTLTRERVVRHSDWLYRLFSHVKIKRIDFYKWALGNKIPVLCVINSSSFFQIQLSIWHFHKQSLSSCFRKLHWKKYPFSWVTMRPDCSGLATLFCFYVLFKRVKHHSSLERQCERPGKVSRRPVCDSQLSFR